MFIVILIIVDWNNKMGKILLCDKCRQPVPDNNSVGLYELHFNDNWGAAVPSTDRHLNPVEGEFPCEGSPSRVSSLRGRFPHNYTGFIDTSEWKR